MHTIELNALFEMYTLEHISILLIMFIATIQHHLRLLKQAEVYDAECGKSGTRTLSCPQVYVLHREEN